MDVGWYRTLIRSFERESFNIPNSVFSRNVVLNITRKQREWRFFEFVGETCMGLALDRVLALQLQGLFSAAVYSLYPETSSSKRLPASTAHAGGLLAAAVVNID